MWSRDGSKRAVAPVISTILLVAITVIFAAVIGTFVLDIGEDVSDPGPNIAETAGSLELQEDDDGGIVRIIHVAGDAVAVEDMEVVVDATDACGERARILNLPAEASFFGTNTFDSENFAAGEESVIDEGTAFTWDIGVLHVENKNTFEAGASFEFRITSGGCELAVGDEIQVDLIHAPTNTIMVTQELQVRE